MFPNQAAEETFYARMYVHVYDCKTVCLVLPMRILGNHCSNIPHCVHYASFASNDFKNQFQTSDCSQENLERFPFPNERKEFSLPGYMLGTGSSVTEAEGMYNVPKPYLCKVVPLHQDLNNNIHEHNTGYYVYI